MDHLDKGKDLLLFKACAITVYGLDKNYLGAVPLKNVCDESLEG
jgi:hypothetical protein